MQFKLTDWTVTVSKHILYISITEACQYKPNPQYNKGPVLQIWIRPILPSFNMMFCRSFPLGSRVQAVAFELSEGCPCVSHPLCSQRDLSACVERLWLTALPWISRGQNKMQQEKEQDERGEVTTELDRKEQIR